MLSNFTDTVYNCSYTFVAVNLGADEHMSLLHDIVAEWKLLAIALDVNIEAGRTSGSVLCEQFMSEMIHIGYRRGERMPR